MGGLARALRGEERLSKKVLGRPMGRA